MTPKKTSDFRRCFKILEKTKTYSRFLRSFLLKTSDVLGITKFQTDSDLWQFWLQIINFTGWFLPQPRIYQGKWLAFPISWWNFFVAKTSVVTVIFFKEVKVFLINMTIMHSIKDSKYLILFGSFLHLLEWMGQCRQWAGGNHREGLVTAVKHHELHDQTVPQKMKSTERVSQERQILVRTS